MATDNRGTEITVGATVCYNWQGQIGFGTVEKIVKDIYHVKRLFPQPPHSGYTWKSVSKVTSPKNLMVIFE
jgi:hypothetical protein